MRKAIEKLVLNDEDVCVNQRNLDCIIFHFAQIKILLYCHYLSKKQPGGKKAKSGSSGALEAMMTYPTPCCNHAPWSTVRQSADRLLGELFFMFTKHLLEISCKNTFCAGN